VAVRDQRADPVDAAEGARVQRCTMIVADLNARTALITGAASGIGLATATLFARSGARVALNDRADNPALTTAVQRLAAEGLDVLAVPGDAGAQAAMIVNEAVAALGRLDYLVNNAGTSRTARPIPPVELDALSDDMWRDILDLNLVGPFRCTRAAAVHLRAARGAVVNTASTAAFGLPGSSMAYAASKAGLVSLTRNLARALAPQVRVNAVAPGFIRTPWTARFGADWEALSVNMNCLQRPGEPEDIAEAMLFLCAGAGFVTGQTLIVDGGM
jgi:3-oxoacyl-[acyl-carrier protein] reductase